MSTDQIRSRKRFLAAGLLSIVAGFALARCGAQDVNAPATTEGDAGRASSCQSLDTAMPEFFKLLRDPKQPLEGIREVIFALASGEKTKIKNNSFGNLLSITLQGLTNFSRDPKESNGDCLRVSEAFGPPAAPLCTISGERPCESRICALRRALDFGVRDEAASTALDALQPLLAKVLGYLSNSGPGADGSPHYEMFDVLHRTAINEARCAPANLLDVMDGVVVYFRSSRECGTNCAGLKGLQAVDDLLRDPNLQSFLQTYENSESSGKGREAFQGLGKVLGNAFANMPEDEHYFDSIQKVVDTLVKFFDSDPNRKYENLKQKVLVVVDLAKQLLDPKRPNAFSAQLKAVVGCVTAVDSNQEIVGALYDLLSRPGGVDGNGVDLKEFVGSLLTLAKLDKDGVLMGAIHTVLASIRANETNMSVVRQFLVDFITIDNARKMLPAVRLMVEGGVVTEFLNVVDGLLYGCQAGGAE